MTEKLEIKPMRLWKSILFFGIPAAIGWAGFYWLLPALERGGISLFWNYMICVVGIFPLLLLFSFGMLWREQKNLSWAAIKKRFRIKPIERKDRIRVIIFIIIFVLGSLS